VDDASSPDFLTQYWQSLVASSNPRQVFLTQYWAEKPDAYFLVWMMPPGILLSHYPVGPVASPRCVAHSSYYFGGSEVHYAASSSLLIFWDSQLTSDHLTQARAILRPVRPSGRSPNNTAIYAYIPSLLTKNAHESKHIVDSIWTHLSRHGDAHVYHHFTHPLATWEMSPGVGVNLACVSAIHLHHPLLIRTFNYLPSTLLGS
jgi:hypothetical protein